MTRAVAIGALIAMLAVFVIVAFQKPFRPKTPPLETKHVYLLVDVDAPPEWVTLHSPSVEWRGKQIALPVVFRAPFNSVRQWGALDEGRQGLDIMGTEATIRLSTKAPCRVSNDPAFGLLTENGGTKYTTHSVITLVTVGPTDRVADGSVFPGRGTSGQRPGIENHTKALIAAGSVIDVGDNH